MRGATTRKEAAGRLWVTVQINVPLNYNLDVTTGGGNIQIDNVNGRAMLTTAGGNIVAGNTTGSERLATKGGHITVKNVGRRPGGDDRRRAHHRGNNYGDCDVTYGWRAHSGREHRRAGTFDGRAAETLSVEHSANQLVAETVGGQIEVGEAVGQVHAKTAAGGIHVVRVAGPTNLETGGGSIYLTQVDGTVKASTGTGAITAWFVTPAKSESTCEFESGEGDIVVYIPRQLPVTIDAVIQSDDRHQFYVDPAFRLLITRNPGPNGGETLHAVGSLNGGGEVVHLRTVSGNIRLIASDAAKQVEIYKHQMQQLQENLQMQRREYDRTAEAAKSTP